MTLLCAAVMISCGGNKEKSAECNGNHAECTHQCEGEHKHECDGNHQDCTGNCDDCANKCEEPAAAGPVILDAATFAQKVADINAPEWKYLGDKPALVDFYADWCGPCKMIAPIVEAISEEREDILVGKVNVDDEMELASAFGIASIPTVVLVKDGKVAATSVGYRPKADLLKMLDL